MERPSRNRKTVNYFQDDDDEDFASVKPPLKKPRTVIKEPESARNQKTTSTCPSEVVDLTGSEPKKRVCLDDKLYERDLEAALTLSLLDSSGMGQGEPKTTTDDHDKPPQILPPVLTHCSAEGSHLDEGKPPDSPPVLSNCSVDGSSLGLNEITSMQAIPPSVSKPRKASVKSTEQQRRQLGGEEEKDSGDDESYQPQNTPDSESDADFSEEDESEDETFTVKKKKEKTMKQKSKKETSQAAKTKKEKNPVKNSKAKSTAASPVISRSPAASVSALRKTPTTPPISKPALTSSPAGGRLPVWNPPGLVGRSPGASQNVSVKSPGQGLRLGLSRLARVKPLHPNPAAH